jgi:hypothetical protein
LHFACGNLETLLAMGNAGAAARYLRAKR